MKKLARRQQQQQEQQNSQRLGQGKMSWHEPKGKRIGPKYDFKMEINMNE